jgi:uncharacterized membrane protein
MNNIRVGEALRVGWKKFQERPWYFIGIYLAVFALFSVTTSNAMFTALAYIVYCGLMTLMLKHYDGEHVEFDDLFSIERTWISFTFMSVVKTLCIMLGFILFIIPGVYLSLRWMYAELLVIDRGMKPIAALKESARLSEGRMWQLLWFAIATWGVMLLGFVCLLVGLLPAAVVVTFAYIHIYRTMFSAVPLETA